MLCDKCDDGCLDRHMGLCDGELRKVRGAKRVAIGKLSRGQASTVRDIPVADVQLTGRVARAKGAHHFSLDKK